MLLISDKNVYNNLRDNIGQAQQRAFEAQREASTGVRVQGAADDPVAAGRGSALGARLATLSSMGQINSQAQSRLEGAEQAINSAFEVVQRVRELAILGINAGLAPQDKMDIGAEVTALSANLLSLANSSGDQGYLFSGNLNVAPFDATGLYAGDSGIRLVDLAPNVRLGTNIPGDKIFNVTGGYNAFAVLSDLAAALNADDTSQMAAQITKLDGVLNQFNSARSGLAGTRLLAQLGDQNRIGTELAVRQTRSQALEADQAASYVKAVEAQTALQSAIAQSTRILTQMQNNPLTH